MWQTRSFDPTNELDCLSARSLYRSRVWWSDFLFTRRLYMLLSRPLRLARPNGRNSWRRRRRQCANRCVLVCHSAEALVCLCMRARFGDLLARLRARRGRGGRRVVGREILCYGSRGCLCLLWLWMYQSLLHSSLVCSMRRTRRKSAWLANNGRLGREPVRVAPRTRSISP